MTGQEPVGRRKSAPREVITYELFPMQPPADDLPWPDPKGKHSLSVGKASWSHYRGPHRPCGVCTRVIHERGQGGAPYPHPATLKRRVGGTDEYVCYRHGARWQEMDKAAVAKADAAEVELALRRQAAARRTR